MILPSQRGHLYVLERARVVVRDGRVEYVSDEGRGPRAFNIPISNTMLLLLGPGSSITTEAVRMLKTERVCFGFTGSGGTPLLAADDEPYIMYPADEYRDPSYLQRWIELWRDESLRLLAAKIFMKARADAVLKFWSKAPELGPWPDAPERKIETFKRLVASAANVQILLGLEGDLTKDLYAAAATRCGFPNFTREPRSTVPGLHPNRLLDHGNYLAYGVASVAIWTLGIPASLPVIHGKTRRGALVFDVADVVKDAIVLPLAFNIANRAKNEGLTETDFRSAVIDAFVASRALDVMFNVIKEALDEAAP